MKELRTLTENQLLFLAQEELIRRIDILKAEIKTHTIKQSLKRIRSLLNMYQEQLNEIAERREQLNRNFEDEDLKMNSRLIDFNGTIISAEEIDWVKINQINDKAENYMDYLGNYFADDSNDVYALFAMDDKADRKKFCVKID